jgi:hypothetical protein
MSSGRSGPSKNAVGFRYNRTDTLLVRVLLDGCWRRRQRSTNPAHAKKPNFKNRDEKRTCSTADQSLNKDITQKRKCLNTNTNQTDRLKIYDLDHFVTSNATSDARKGSKEKMNDTCSQSVMQRRCFQSETSPFVTLSSH